MSCSEVEDGSLAYEQVAKRGGHSNYRTLLRAGKTSADFLKTWPVLQQLGCAYESSMSPEDVFAIDVPPSTDVSAVYRVLKSGEDEGLWHLDEGNFAHGDATPAT